MNLFQKAKKKEKRQELRKCLNCGGDFKAKKSVINRGWGLFCSKSCSSIWTVKEKKSKKMKRDKNLSKLGF